MNATVPLPPRWERLGEGTSATIKSAVDEATGLLSAGRTDTPRLDAEVLMSFVLGWPRARLFAHWDEDLRAEEWARYLGFVARRAAGEPVAYIRNLKEFLGLEFYVDARVLIPRPETELLVTHAIKQVQGRSPCRGLRTQPVVADIGTGSGAVAIAILKSCAEASLIATDISEDALAVARLNAQRHSVAPNFRTGSLLDPLQGQVDLIVANLPYLSRAEYESLLDTSIVYEPRQALTDDADGLRWFDQLLAQAPAKLAPGGAILLEIGSSQPAALLHLARERLPDFEPAIYADYAGLPRVLCLSHRGGRG